MIDLKLGPYEIRGEVGRGGMATVYRAYQPTVDREVAIKVIYDAGLINDAAIDRFQQEARMIARLEHPHILPIYDFNGEHDPPYIVMRYMDGGTLYDLMNRRALPFDQLGLLFRQISSALDHAHSQGVIHRDVKPANILLDRSGNVFVSDFGLARLITHQTDDSNLTQQGMVVGTPGYMAPEQARGIGQLTPQADIYALGVMLFEMLTGQRPYHADSLIGLVMKHIHDPIPSAYAINSTLPIAVDTVLNRALAKNPSERFPTASAFVEAAIQALGGLVALTPVRQRHSPTGDSVTAPYETTITRFDASSIVTKIPTSSAQQKQVTLLLVNWKEAEEIVLETRDIEDAFEVIRSLAAETEKIVTDHGGQVYERTRQGLQAAWGLTEADEHDPEWAIRGALTVREAIRAMLRKVLPDNPAPIQLVLNTGMILQQAGMNPEKLTLTGQPITFAQKIEQITPPDTILITPDTYRHVIGVFDMYPERSMRVRGQKDPVDLYRVERTRPRAFRLSTRGIEGIETRMIGREAELKTLQESLLLTIEDRETQMVTCVGEAGVGKSRLLFEFSKWADGIEETVRLFQGRAIQQSMAQPYALIRDIFSFRFEILESDPLPLAREKFEAGIAGFMGADSLEQAQLIGHLIGFDFSESVYIKQILSDGKLLRERALGYILALLHTIAADGPVMVQVEDIHWADDPSLDVIHDLVFQNRNLPLMVVCMARPEFYERRPAWGEGEPFQHRIDLKPLSKLDSRRLVREVLQKVAEVPPELRDLIIDRAEGNPFYVEELVKVLIEDGVIVKQKHTDPELGETEVWQVLSDRLSPVRVPLTLTGVLQARLDRLPPAEKLLLQRASVLGRVFWDSAVLALSKADGNTPTPSSLNRMLNELRRREFIYQRETSAFAGAREYTIKHAILHDVIYETLLKRQQRAYHAAAAEWLAATSGDRVSEYATLIAEHYEKAGDPLQAAMYLIRVSQNAYQISAYDEAQTAIDHALSLIEGDDRQEVQMIRLKIWNQQGSLLTAIGNWHGAKAFLETTLAAARSLNDTSEVVQAVINLAFPLQFQGELDRAYNLIKETLPIARATGNKEVLSILLRRMGSVLTFGGNTDEAAPYLRESLALARDIGDKQLTAKTLGELGNMFNMQNDIDSALETIAEVATISKSIGARHIYSLALGNKASIHLQRQEYKIARESVLEVLPIARSIGSQNTTAWLLSTLGRAEAQLGETAAARITLREALQRGSEIGDNTTMMISLASEGYLRVMAGHLDGIELIGIGLYHPQTDDNVRIDVELLLPSLKAGPLATLSDTELQAALERGGQRDLHQTVRDVLVDLSTTA